MNQEESLKPDSAAARPLPKWLTDQKDGVTLYKPREIIIKKDSSLVISFGITVIAVILVVVLAGLILKRKSKKKGV